VFNFTFGSRAASRLPVVCTAATIAVLLPVSAGAGPARDLGALRKYVGTIVYIQDVAGNVTSRRLADATNSELIVAGATGREAVAAARIASVSVDGDSLWNGLLIGGALGGALALVPVGGAEQPSRAGLAGAGVALGAAIGTWRDWRRRGQTVVYRAP